MDRITRKELKQDRFAQEVGHTVEYLGEHRKQAIRIGAAALAVIVLVAGFLAWRRYDQRARATALANALEINNAPVGDDPSAVRSFPTAEAKRKESVKAFSDVAAKYSGSDEGVIAQYYLGSIAAGEGNFPEAEKQLRVALDDGSGNYASLAALSLANVYAAEGKTAEAEKLLRGLMNKPTEFVSKQQAQLALGNVLAGSKPDEARKLLEPLRTESGAVSRAAISALADLNAGKR